MNLALATLISVAAPTGGGAASDPDLEQAILILTNADRTSNGVAALMVDDRLLAVARSRSDDMIARNYFSHAIPPSGQQVFPLIEAQGVDYEAAAENLAESRAPRPAAARDAQGRFLDSSAHRSNLLSGRWRFIGVGATPGSDRTIFTVLFMLPFPTDPAYARLTIGPPPEAALPSENSADATGPVETVVDTVLSRNLGIGGLD